MIVEDEIIVAKDIQHILKKLGYEAFDPFSNGKKALYAIEKLNPDLILLDINLKSSEMDGIQVAEQVSQNYQIPFIFLTAFSDKNTLERAKVTEPYGYIIKPFEEDVAEVLVLVEPWAVLPTVAVVPVEVLAPVT